MAELIVTKGPAAGQRFTLFQTVLIGRSREADISLDDRGVSRQHARIVSEGEGQYSIQDQGSDNGTLVNGVRIQSQRLNAGDEITVGKNVMVFRVSEEPSAAAGALDAKPEASSMLCPNCGTSLAMLPALVGRQCRCPNCKNAFIAQGGATAQSTPLPPQTLPAPGGLASTVRYSPEQPPSTPGPPPNAPSRPAPSGPAEDFPEFMKANRRIAERTCPRCQVRIELGDDVFNCRACGSSMHEACHSAAGGCVNPSCPQAHFGLAPLAPAAPAGTAVSTPMAPDEKPCRFCGELIKVSARKCRFCNEFQSDVDRNRSQSKARSVSDEKLSGWEILLGVLCSGIACIVAIVYLVQGKKKGWKLLLLSIIMQAILACIRLAVKGE